MDHSDLGEVFGMWMQSGFMQWCNILSFHTYRMIVNSVYIFCLPVRTGQMFSERSQQV